jgi:hypothetical protein
LPLVVVKMALDGSAAARSSTYIAKYMLRLSSVSSFDSGTGCVGCFLWP